MKRFNSTELEGIGGWLSLFQARMYAGLVSLLVLPASPLLALLTAAALVACLGLFYRHCTRFRVAYVAAAMLGIAAAITALPAGLPYLIAQAALDAVVIPALFKSRRVRNTFSLRECEGKTEIVDGWYGREQSRCCYDMYFVASRCIR